MLKNNKEIILHFEKDCKVSFVPEFDTDINIRTVSVSGEEKEITSIYVSISEAEEYIVALQEIVNFLKRGN